MSALITTPHGARVGERYMISDIRGSSLRVARTGHHENALSIAREWDAGNHVWTPGTVRRLAFPIAPPERKAAP